MLGRRLAAATLLAGALVLVALQATAAGSGTARSTVYRVRPDPRLCPSPMCGGFWVSAVNRPTTTCLDGVARGACYVARVDLQALPPGARDRLRAALAEGRALVAGSFAPAAIADFAGLAGLAASRAWIAAAPSPSTAPVYQVVDTGIRCVAAPCFSWRATLVNGARTIALSSLDLSRVPGVRSGGRAWPTLVAGTVRVARKTGTAKAGRTLVATQLWARVAGPSNG